MKNSSNLPMRERLKLIEARIVKLEKALTEDLGEVAEEAPARAEGGNLEARARALRGCFVVVAGRWRPFHG